MPTPQILTSSEWDTWLSSDVQSQSDLDLIVWRAEQKVIGRYREHEPGSSDAVRETTDGAWVQLVGWEETEDGDPDLPGMPDDLVTALRDTIARIVTHWHEAPGGDIKSKSVGSRSVTYADQADKLPRSVYQPLRPYDDRTPYAPGA
jgi:hypothetical protein